MVATDLDLDFEFDQYDFEEQFANQPRQISDQLALIVDDLHITYRVYGGEARDPNAAPSMLERVGLSRGHAAPETDVEAIRGISFAARRGESIGILGTNGSGKSTLLRAIAGVHPPNKGRVWAASEPALLGISSALNPNLSGERNIMLGGLALGLERKQVQAQIGQVARFAELGDFLYLPMRSYSSGMGARLRFAISTMRVPDILMIDEALATGDSAFKKKSLRRIEQVQRNAGTIFFVSHSLASVRAICNRAIWIDQGELIMDGDVDEVANAYEAFIQNRGSAPAGARLFASAPTAPSAPLVNTPTQIHPKSKLEISWQPDGNFQRKAEVAVTNSRGRTWIPKGGQVIGPSTELTLDAATHPSVFGQDEVEIQVRTWGLATQGGSDDTGASEWSESAPVLISESAPLIVEALPRVVPPVETTHPRVVEPVETTQATSRLVEPVETTQATSRVVEPVETTQAITRVVEPVETTQATSRVVEPVETSRVVPPQRPASRDAGDPGDEPVETIQSRVLRVVEPVETTRTVSDAAAPADEQFQWATWRRTKSPGTNATSADDSLLSEDDTPVDTDSDKVGFIGQFKRAIWRTEPQVAAAAEPQVIEDVKFDNDQKLDNDNVLTGDDEKWLDDDALVDIDKSNWRKRSPRGLIIGAAAGALALVASGAAVAGVINNFDAEGEIWPSGTDDFAVAQAPAQPDPVLCRSRDLSLRILPADIALDPAPATEPTDIPRFAVGHDVYFNFEVTNVSATDCIIDGGLGSGIFTIRYGETDVFNSSHCPAQLPGRDEIIGAGATLQTRVAWSGHRSAAGECEGAATVPGEYVVQAELPRIGAVPSETTEIRITRGATTPTTPPPTTPAATTPAAPAAPTTPAPTTPGEPTVPPELAPTPTTPTPTAPTPSPTYTSPTYSPTPTYPYPTETTPHLSPSPSPAPAPE